MTPVTTASPSLERRMLARALDEAGVLLWSARVTQREDRFSWVFSIAPESASSPLLRYAHLKDATILWRAEDAPDHAATEQTFRNALARGAHGYRQEFRLQHEHEIRWVEEVVEIEPLEPGVWLFAGVTHDITDRKQAEEAERRTTAEFHRVLERTECLLWHATVIDDGSHKFLWEFSFTPSGLQQRLFPSLRPLRGTSIYEGYESEDFAANDARAVAALRSGAAGYEQEFAITRRRDGLRFWLHEQVTITPIGHGRWQLTGVTIDITARRLAEQANRDAVARLNQLLERADCVLWEAVVTDDDSYLWQWDFRFLPSGLQQRIFPHYGGRVVHDVYAEFAVPAHPEMLARAQHAMRSGAPGYEQQFEIRRHRDGAIFWLQERVAITSLGPKCWQMVGVMIEITAAKIAAQARERTELQLRQILGQVDCMLWQGEARADGEGGYEWSLTHAPSPLFRRLFGREPQPAERALWTADIALDYPAMAATACSALNAGAPGYTQEFRGRATDGVVWLREQATVVRRDGDTVHLVGVITDITARKLAELQLVTEKELLAVTLRAMDEAVVTLGLGGEVTFLNRAAEELLHTRLASAVGQPLAALGQLTTGPRALAASWPIAPALRERQSVDLPADAQLAQPTGRTVRIEGCIAPLHDLQSQPQGAVLVFRDVTERHVLEGHLQRAATLESVGLLAGGIAHDFNNILTAIIGNLELAQYDAPPGSLLATSLDEAAAAATRARGLSQQLLTFAKGGDPVLTAVDLGAVIREVSQFTVRGTRVVCTYELPADLWPASADRGQIAQIVQNLVLNAVQAMPEGGTIHLATANERRGASNDPHLPPGDYVRLTVRDSGRGIAPEDLNRIFTPYFTTRREGHGLGLAVVYSIVRKHHGAIDVSSTPGQGTTFVLHLPAARAQAVDTDGAPPPLHQPLRGRLLIMEDEASIRTVLTTFLQRLGLTVEVSGDGADAVARYRAARAAGTPFDLLIMDLTVPGQMGGREAMAAIHTLDPGARAIVASGYSSDPVMANYRDYGFVAAAPKPFSLPRLAELITEQLAAPKSSDAPATPTQRA